MNKIQRELKKYADPKYIELQKKLIPCESNYSYIGVRSPDIAKVFKTFKNDPKTLNEFMDELPHKYLDEYTLHGAIISSIKDYDECIKRLEEYLPYLDNWATCDGISPKCFKNNTDKLIKKIKKWVKSKETYTCRIAIKLLMSFYLGDAFKKEYLDIPASVHSNEYYVNMMQAWFYATALSCRWDETIIYLEENKLDTWVHNKTIQKAVESYRITDKQKKYLKTLRRSKEK